MADDKHTRYNRSPKGRLRWRRYKRRKADERDQSAIKAIEAELRSRGLM